MSPLQANISEALLPDLTGVTVHEKWLNCAADYPWYPLPWLMLADPANKASIQKAALWFADEQKLHWLLHAKPWHNDTWLEEQVKTIKEPTDRVEEANESSAMTAEASRGTDTRDDYKVEAPQPGDYEPANATVADTALTGLAVDMDEIVNESAVSAENNETRLPEEPEVSHEAEEEAIETIAVDMNSVSTGSELAPNEPATVDAHPTVSEPLAFEPFHSVDYFASQGIKLELPPEPQDKFDRQLKSFTQWLKTMKKVSIQETVETDPAVEAQANASVSGKEIITEAMAQVLEMQGKNQKAAEVYEKLLLMYPEKSVFFAARIEELKNKQ
jgi:hypothetical protein